MQSEFVQNNSHFFGNETISIFSFTCYHVLNAGRIPHVCDESPAFHVWSTSMHTISEYRTCDVCVSVSRVCAVYHSVEYLEISQKAVKKQRLVEGMLHFTHAPGPKIGLSRMNINIKALKRRT